MTGKWIVALGAVGMVIGLVAEEPALPENSEAVDPRDARIAELEQENTRLRAELILLKNQMANQERREDERASEVELRAREAIEQLLPQLRISPNPSGGLPNLHVGELPAEATGIRIP